MQMEQAQIVIFDEQTIDRWLLQSGAAPRILRWGTKQDSRSERAEKKLYPPTFTNVGVQASKCQ